MRTDARSENKQRILFVDDEKQLLYLVKLSMKRFENIWETEFAESGEEALKLIDQKPFDVVVTDMRMPGMNGAELLNIVAKKYPPTIRIVLSGYADESAVMRCVGVTHQFLTKPFDLGMLRNTLSRFQALNEKMQSNDIKFLLRQVKVLPSLPSTYLRIVDMLKSTDASIEDIAGIVSTDVALTAKLLQLVNSAFFGFSRKVGTAAESVQLLGISRIRALALSLQLFSSFENLNFSGFSIDQIWNHSIITGLLARSIIESEAGSELQAEETFTAGMLADVGKIILAANLPDDYSKVYAMAREGNMSLQEAEMQQLKTTHSDVGAYLLGIWGLPVPLVEAVAFCHTPALVKNRESNMSPLVAVHIADALAAERSESKSDIREHELDINFIKTIGLDHRLDAYRSLMNL